MKNFPVDDIPSSSYFSKTVYLDNHFILATPEIPFTKDISSALKEWSFSEVFSEGEPGEYYDDKAGISSMTGEAGKIQEAENFYASLMQFTESLFDDVLQKRKLKYESVVEKIKTVCSAVKEDHNYLMRAQYYAKPADDESYIVSHLVRTTVLALIIGIYLKLPQYRLIELGAAALLHDIGMIFMSPKIYLSDKVFSDVEKKAFHAHPVQGYRILKSFGFPLDVCLAALEHHERENGSGYPQGFTGDKISLYGKITAVACSFEAISAKRHHKEAKNTYSGMLELLRNEGKQYNDTVIRAIVYSLSIYPVGLHVLLSNDKKGQVIFANPEDPRFPVVQIIGELLPNGKKIITQTSENGLSIARPLALNEIGG